MSLNDSFISNNHNTGTRSQQLTKKTLREKQTTLKNKYNAFERIVKKFINDFPTAEPVVCPPFDDMKRISLADRFWDIGQLTHPGQPWAVDQDTQDGIRAYLDMTHARDELHRLSRECRQAINWALETEKRLSDLNTALEVTENDSNKWIVSVVRSRIPLPADRLKKSKEVLRSLYSRVLQEHARLVMFWNCGMLDVLSCTKTYSHLTAEAENELITQWTSLVVRSRLTWSAGAQAGIVEAVPLDEGEEAERLLNLDEDGDEDEDEAEDEDSTSTENEDDLNGDDEQVDQRR
ncbi:hypothetical protein DFH28DRAFT_901547 [Melampsora americana]|nr:hypothetical protein DFH28DRAFT_901547 [Melampsora americana]